MDAIEEIIRPLLRDVPDFPKPGILFKDITPLLADPVARKKVVVSIAESNPTKDAVIPEKECVAPAICKFLKCAPPALWIDPVNADIDIAVFAIVIFEEPVNANVPELFA